MDDEHKLPFKPSWVDRFTDWLESLPGPYWSAILAIYLFLGVQSQIVDWIAGRSVWGEPNLDLFIYPLFTAEVLFFWKFLDRDAVRALADFRPSLSVNEEEYTNLAYRLTHQSSRSMAIATMFGLVVGAYFYYSVELATTGTFELSWLSVYGVFGFTIPMTLALVFCYRIINQLRIVSRLYESASDINLYNLDPVYALSSHTAKTGLIFLLLIYTNLILSPGTIQLPVAIITTISLSILSFAAFVLPLRGINRRLVADKKALVRDVNNRIKKAFELLDSDFDRLELGQMQNLEKTIINLERQKAFVEKIPTWPWGSGTMRGFVSAVLLPILLYVIQQILNRLLVF